MQMIFSTCDSIGVWRLRHQVPIEGKTIYILFHPLMESVMAKKEELFTRTSEVFPRMEGLKPSPDCHQAL